MALTASALRSLTQGTDADAWRVIIAQAVEIASKPLAIGNAPSEVVKRDREIGGLDLFGLVTVLCRSPISLCHLGFERERADAAQI